MWKIIWYKRLWQIIDSEFQVSKVKQVEKTIYGQIIVEWKWKLQYVKQFWNVIQVQQLQEQRFYVSLTFIIIKSRIIKL